MSATTEERFERSRVYREDDVAVEIALGMGIETRPLLSDDLERLRALRASASSNDYSVTMDELKARIANERDAKESHSGRTSALTRKFRRRTA